MEENKNDKKKSAWDDFINSLEGLNELPTPPEPEPEEGSKFAELVDTALTRWIQTKYPNGFDFDVQARDLMVEMLDLGNDIRIDFPLHVYIDAILVRVLEQNQPVLLAMRTALVFGLALAQLMDINDERSDAPE